MRYFAIFSFIFCMGLCLGVAKDAFALSCVRMDADMQQQMIDQTDLIAKARILSIKKPLVGQLIYDTYDEQIEFELLDVYQSLRQEGLLETITVSFPNYMRTWGPDLKEGDVGEYLFRKESRGWVYSGPGACTYLENSQWEALRSKKAAQ